MPRIIKILSLRFSKMNMKSLPTIFLAVLLILSSATNAVSQDKKNEDKPETISMLFPAYAFQFPGGDLPDRFGTSSAVGPGFMVKSSSNWLFGVDANFIFGNKLNEDSLLNNLLTSDGYIINEAGEYADIGLFERGFYSSAKIGKVIPIFGSNKNSGLMILFGGGYLQHKIRIEVKDNNAAQLRGDYKKGYDRLTDGFQVNEFVGYMHVGETRMANFFIGIEFVQAWTENRRSMNFDLMRRDDSKRLDMLTGIKVGWIFPLRKSMPKDFYYY